MAVTGLIDIALAIAMVGCIWAYQTAAHHRDPITRVFKILIVLFALILLVKGVLLPFIPLR